MTTDEAIAELERQLGALGYQVKEPAVQGKLSARQVSITVPDIERTEFNLAGAFQETLTFEAEVGLGQVTAKGLTRARTAAQVFDEIKTGLTPANGLTYVRVTRQRLTDVGLVLTGTLLYED